MSDAKRILCLDFDGVLHSYTSGWQGSRNILDPPVDGELKFLEQNWRGFQLCIFSSRSHYFGGRWAMKKMAATSRRSVLRNAESFANRIFR